MKHTPGPWMIDEVADVVTADGSLVANPFDGLPGRETDPAIALSNAYLIAAAPEMLQSLKTIRKTLIDMGGDVMPTLDAVIAKAEGKCIYAPAEVR